MRTASAGGHLVTNVRLRRAKGETSSRAGEHWGAASVERWSHSDMMQRALQRASTSFSVLACTGVIPELFAEIVADYWFDHIFFLDSQQISLP